MKFLLSGAGILALAIMTVTLPRDSLATSQVFSITLKDAETRALSTSEQLKALDAVAESANEQADAQFSFLLPKLTLSASYQYLTNIPSISFPGSPLAIPFGAHDNYSAGPTLSYTLWDTGGTRDSYRGLSLLADSRKEDRKSGELQLLLGVRSSYLRLQLALEELRVLGNSLDLARAQNRDIEANFRAGAATRLDRLESQREVLTYGLQFDQKQAEVELDFRDLLAWLHEPSPEIRSPLQELKLDSLEASLLEAGSWHFSPPGDSHPQLKSQEFLAESSERAATSQMSALYPTIQVSASALIEYPIGPVLERTQQNVFAASLSMPLFEASHTRHLAAAKRMEAEAARMNREQLKINLDRDYQKTLDLLRSLRSQQKIAAEDVEKSREAARLYYQSYKGGRMNLIDVLSANNRALASQVNAARIDAQILTQLFALQSLTGEARRAQ